MADPDAPTCPRCVRFVWDPKRGRLFMRCLACALAAMVIRNEEARRG